MEKIYEECREMSMREKYELEEWVDSMFDAMSFLYWEPVVDAGLVEVIGCDYEEDQDPEEVCPLKPMWRTVFKVKEDAEYFARWIEKHADEVAKVAGFIVYKDVEDNVILGVNGAGYDFIRAHFCPLKKLFEKSR